VQLLCRSWSSRKPFLLKVYSTSSPVVRRDCALPVTAIPVSDTRRANAVRRAFSNCGIMDLVGIFRFFFCELGEGIDSTLHATRKWPRLE